MPVLEPSTFSLLDELDAAAWTMVTRRNRSSSSLLADHDKCGSPISNFVRQTESQTGFPVSFSKVGHMGPREITAGFGLKGLFGLAWKQTTIFAPRVYFTLAEAIGDG
jgi:hypothetical protein